MTSKRNQPPSRTRGRDQMGMGINNNTSAYSTLRSRARVKERFYDPAIASDVDAAVDYALAETGGDRAYRTCWCFYCIHLGLNTFLDQLWSVLACVKTGELDCPYKAFHKRLKRMKDQLDKAKGAK